MARIALTDPKPSLYLARPCQFVSDPACKTAIWTDQRFGQDVLGNLNHALDQVRREPGNRDFELIGYSAGAALALGLAAQRSEISVVRLPGVTHEKGWAKAWAQWRDRPLHCAPQ